MTFDPQQEFCAALKAARERSGVTLDQIAAITKVCPSYFASLENNHLDRWPKGIFRRAFFRGYVTAIGLPAEETVAEFTRLFPESGRPASGEPAPAPRVEECRLTLDESWRGPMVPIGLRLLVAALDVAAVLAISIAMSWLAAVALAPVLAVAAITYYFLGGALLGETPAAACMRWRHLIGKLTDVLRPGQEQPAQEADSDPGQTWITDARRIRPRGEPPRLRVRFKVSP